MRSGDFQLFYCGNLTFSISELLQRARRTSVRNEIYPYVSNNVILVGKRGIILQYIFHSIVFLANVTERTFAIRFADEIISWSHGRD